MSEHIHAAEENDECKCGALLTDIGWFTKEFREAVRSARGGLAQVKP